MHINRNQLKTIGRYMVSFGMVGLAASTIILTARNTYLDVISPQERTLFHSEEQERKYKSYEKKLYGTIFSVGCLTGLVAGAYAGLKKSRGHNCKEDDDYCPHCPYHF